MKKVIKDKAPNFSLLRKELKGELLTSYSDRLLYATDASVYREVPMAIALPKDETDIIRLIGFAKEHNTSLIPRTAGTSLAGQVVGNGIVVDVSRYMTDIIEINPEEKWIRVQPGVILDEMNLELNQFGLFFSPETSTGNRCMIGGMVGNNSCGLHSLIYGSTRDHTLEVKAILSDGSQGEFKSLYRKQFEEKTQLNSLEGRIYQNIEQILSKPENQSNIRKEYPDNSIPRRNTGYAIDLLLESEIFSNSRKKFNFSELIAGSEGTLCFITEIKLNLIPLPPPEKAVIPVHCPSVKDAIQANLIALKYNPEAIELMDSTILDLTKGNLTQQKNRFFLKGEPGAILIVEFARETREEILSLSKKMELEIRKKELGYHFPIIFDEDIKKVWALRKAGLGVLSNMPGDAKPVSLIEDASVHPEVLPEYIEDIELMLSKYGLSTVYHAHIATGEIHVRPVLNLKDPKNVELFHKVGEEAARIIKKHKGSLSGEHGDGRVRGEFIPVVIGENNFELLREIKYTWDPDNIFNPGKIVDTPRMNTFLRYEPGAETRELETLFDFSDDLGMIRAVEKCNGSGDCRKTYLMGGTMCPSYMASKDEKNTTRARANILREYLTNSDQTNPFNHQEIYDVLDLCLMCKGCKSECPSSVDITKYKAEFLQHYYDSNGISLRTRAIAYISSMNKLGSIMPFFYNLFVSNVLTSGIMKWILGFAPKRSIPKLYKITLKSWLRKNLKKLKTENPKGKVFLFADEFTDYNDTQIGISAVKLLSCLGYEVELPKHTLSGRTFLSKGLVRKARKLAVKNVTMLKDTVNKDSPLIGIEPSGILSFRDEYPELVGKELKLGAEKLAKNCFMIDEFIMQEVKKGNITKNQFTGKKEFIRLHGHCHQKALASTGPTKEMLSLPENYEVEEIKSGCCGMAGSFGYEKEHYELSMKVGELVLFPAVRNSEESTIISAPGTSCRHQIKDGTGRMALHPVEVLYEALKYHLSFPMEKPTP